MKLFYNTRLCTLILSYMIVILLPCFGIFIGIMYANFQLFQGIVFNSSLEILNRQFSKQIQTFSLLSKQMIEYYQFRENQRLESLNKIYQFTWDIDIKLKNIEQCANKKYSKFSGKCSMCYGMNETINLSKTNFNKYLKIANLFSLTFFMGDNSFDMVFAGTSEEKFIAIWPLAGIAATPPDAQARPWYILEHNQPNTSELYSTHFTQPYIHFALKTVTISHTQTLYDTDFSRIGVVSIQLNFSQTFPSFLQNSTTTKGYILDENYYILQKKEQDPSINTFFDSNVTGFDNSSAHILKAYLKDHQILQSCQILNTNLLCLTDVHNQEYVVQAYILQKNNQILILVFNPAHDLQVLQQRQDTLVQNIDKLIQDVLIETIPPNVGLLILTILIIYLIANKISEITKQAQAVVFKNNADHFKMFQLQIFDFENKVSQNCLEKLERAFVTLNHKMIHNQSRNPQCQKFIEMQEYLEKDKFTFIDLKKSIRWIQNKNFCPPKLFVKKIINEGILVSFHNCKKTK